MPGLRLSTVYVSQICVKGEEKLSPRAPAENFLTAPAARDSIAAPFRSSTDKRNSGDLLKEMKVLVIGSGGREHALCRTLRLNALGAPPRLFCAPGNAGIAEDAECVSISATDVAVLADFAEGQKIELTIPGGESSLA